MKRLFLLLFCGLLLVSTAAPNGGSWTERLIDWVAEFFGGGDDERAANELSEAELARISATPLGKLLSEVAQSDTLAVTTNWPYPSVDVAADLERRQRLLRQTALLNNPGDLLPLPAGHALRVIYRSDQRPFRLLEMLRRFGNVQEVAYGDLVPAALAGAPALTTLVVADDPPGASPFNADWYRELTDLSGEFIFLHFGDPSLPTGLPADWAFINSPLRCKETESTLAQAIFGAESLSGRLTEATPSYPAGSGQDLSVVRHGFREPELRGIDRHQLDRVDRAINRAIRYRATPGAQLVVLKDGEVVVERAYGYQSYRKRAAVSPADLYDLASVTKAAATTFAVMKLYDEGRLDLRARVRDYLPEFARKTPGRYRIDQLLTHQTGLQADLPLFRYLGRQFVSDSLRDEFNLPVSENRWLDYSVPGRIRKDLARVDFTRRSIYRYSDINYVLLQFVVEEIAGEPLDEFVAREFYRPLGLGQLTFRPRETFPFARLIPTVHDEWMRGGMVRGFVHDEGAALLGGVAGHAGLFANARDLARLFQLLNDGGGDLLSPETVQLFTERGPYNYRALGFDRLVGGYGNVVSAGAGKSTFGHTGFSGTCVWADPENDLVFVLLTNRIHPDPKNERLLSMHVRARTHRDVYRALGSYRATTGDAAK